MSHDITRDSDLLNRSKGYIRVRRLQGRMFTDADFNEQVDLLERAQRRFIADLIGPHAGPVNDCGFAISFEGGDLTADKKTLNEFRIGRGTYYVDGLRISNPPGSGEDGKKPVPRSSLLPPGVAPETYSWTVDQALLVFLDAWSVPVTALEDPDLLDFGFEGRDSADRERRVWRVGAAVIQVTEKPTGGGVGSAATEANVKDLAASGKFQFVDRPVKSGEPPEALPGPRVGDAFAKLAFVVGPPEGLDPDDHCVILPDPERYTGVEAQLYRLEVHHSGRVPADAAELKKSPARLKWSRDNAAPAYAIESLEEQEPGSPAATPGEGPTWIAKLRSLEALGGLRSLEPQSWVELCDAGWYLRKERLPLLWVVDVDPDGSTATLSLGPGLATVPQAEVKAAVETLRLILADTGRVAGARLVAWDHEKGDFRGLPLELLSGLTPTAYPGVRLEHGIAALVRSSRSSDKKAIDPSLLTGDFWLFPARSGQPSPSAPNEEPDFADPSGPDHVYAPLAALLVTATEIQSLIPLLKTFPMLGQ